MKNNHTACETARKRKMACTMRSNYYQPQQWLLLLLFLLPSVAGSAGFVSSLSSSRPINKATSPDLLSPTKNMPPFKNHDKDDPRVSVSFSSCSSQLFSLQQLIDDITPSTNTNTKSKSKTPQTIFVGGKGGVGKTTVSSALAVELASSSSFSSSSSSNPPKVLIVSTDPAHSLGDALDQDLKRGSGGVRGQPLTLTDPLTGGRLDACEVDAAAALQQFRDNLAAFNVDRLAETLGVSTELLDGLGLREFSGLLNNPPPGLDELVALANILDNDSSVMAQKQYDVVIVDTAPTGHTLRLLALPQFLDGLLGKLIQLRFKLTQLTSTLQAFLGNAQAQERAQAIDTAVNRLESFRTKMAALRARLQNAESTHFVVVTVPTKLGVAESKRLMNELASQQVSVTDIVINQCVDLEGQDAAALQAYYNRRLAGQAKWIQNLADTIRDVSNSEAFRANGSPDPIALTKVPYFDVELVGIPALGYVGSQCFRDNPNFAHLMQDDDDREPKVVICGGKGGVGKTTTSASLAVSMAAQGHKVAIISTDPAHSLGDALDVNLKGGQLIDCPLIGVPATDPSGSLSALEIDPSSALNQFKGIVDKLVGSDPDAAKEESGLRNTLRDLEEIFDTLPAGTDEVVALAKIINVVKKGDFDRIVLDTAPTGHTLRMLSTPGFLAELIDRLLVIAERINSNSMVKMFISSSKRADDIESAADTAKSQLLSFQLQMYDLEDMFANAKQTEFLIVTVATELAARESIRLLNDLTFEAPDMPIKVRNLVVNQVLDESESVEAAGEGNIAQVFQGHVCKSQSASIAELERAAGSVAKPPRITQVRYLDTEPRGVFGLKVLANELMREVEEAVTQE